MQNRALRLGPVALTGTLATTIFNTKITSLAGPAGYTQTQPYSILTHLRVVNTTSGPLAVSLFIGAAATAAAGTEFGFSATVVAAYSYVDWYGRERLENTDYLCGGSTTTGLTISGEGEIGLT
jgi:hypothetical protein